MLRRDRCKRERLRDGCSHVRLCVNRLPHETNPHSVCNGASPCSLLLELAWKEAAGKLGAGEGIRSAAHPRYLGDVADEQVERDIPANMRDRTSHYASRGRGRQTKAHNSRSVDICVMLVGSIPVRRFSPNNLPGRHQCDAAAAQTDQGNAQFGDKWHRGDKGREPARQRIPCDVSAASPVHRHSRDTRVRMGVRTGRASPTTQPLGNGNLTRWVLLLASRYGGSTLPLGGCGGDRLGTACGSYCESTRAHIDESRRSRVMASGNWPVTFCPLRSLHKSALTVGCTGKSAARAGAHASYPADAPQVAEYCWHCADEHGRGPRRTCCARVARRGDCASIRRARRAAPCPRRARGRLEGDRLDRACSSHGTRALRSRMGAGE
jgi:hypothetical protein